MYKKCIFKFLFSRKKKKSPCVYKCTHATFFYMLMQSNWRIIFHSVFFIWQYVVTTKHISSGGTHIESQQSGKRCTNWSFLWVSSVQYIFLLNVRIGIGKSEKQLAMGSTIGLYIPTEAGLFIMLWHPHRLSEPPIPLLNGNLRTLVQKLKPEGLAGSIRVKNVCSFSFICLHRMVLRLSQFTKFYIQFTKCLFDVTQVCKLKGSISSTLFK